MTLPDPAAASRLRWFTLTLLLLNVFATIIAVIANLPAQFGGVGTDAGKEFITRGTAISAPLLPVVLMLLVVLLTPRRDRWSWIGIALGYLTAAVVGIGGVGKWSPNRRRTPQAPCSPSPASPGWPWQPFSSSWRRQR